MKKFCLECNCFISDEVYYYSKEHFGFALCYQHQNWFRNKMNETTPHTLELYFELKKRGVPAKLELFDGNKTIDIAVPDAKVNIEVDGLQHNFNPRQALSDLHRTYYSFLRGYLTLRIPNRLIEWDIQETADYITDFLVKNRENQKKKRLPFDSL
jgi:very-short-patch-repair endonuclease